MKPSKNRFMSLLIWGSACFALSTTPTFLSVFCSLVNVQNNLATATALAQQQTPPKQRKLPQYDLRKDSDRKKLFEMNASKGSANGTFVEVIVSTPNTVARTENSGSVRTIEHDARDITECFTFRIKYDSAAVNYSVDNLRLNTTPVLSENAETRQTMRTQPCRVRGGDTLSFYRSVSWENVELFKRSAWPSRELSAKMSALDRQDLQMRYAFQSSTCYQAYHELAWAIELVSSTTGKRLLLVDSLKFDAQPSPGAPVMQLQAPPMAQIRYVVPASLQRQQAFLRIVPYARAPQQTSQIPAFTTRQNVILGSDFRKDFEGDPARQMLVQKMMTTTMQTINIAEINRTELQTAANRDLISVAVSPNPSSGEVSITLNSPNSSLQHSVEQKYTLVIYNAAGQAQWTWLNAGPSQTFEFRAAASGAYYLVAYDANNHTILRSQPFIIQR